MTSVLRKTLGLAELPVFARELRSHFKSRQILLLQGPMGVGKTELVRELVIASGASNETTSPSFAIHNQYDGIDHLDLYRIESDDELESTGFWDLFSQKQGLILIEWGERLPKEQLPRTWPQLTLEISFTADPNKRYFELKD